MLMNLVVNAIAFYVVGYLVPGMILEGWQALLVVSVVWGLITMFVKPVLSFLTLPINVLSLGLFSFILNALLLMFTASLVPGFGVESFWLALLASLFLSLVNAVLTRMGR